VTRSLPEGVASIGARRLLARHPLPSQIRLASGRRFVQTPDRRAVRGRMQELRIGVGLFNDRSHGSDEPVESLQRLVSVGSMEAPLPPSTGSRSWVGDSPGRSAAWPRPGVRIPVSAFRLAPEATNSCMQWRGNGDIEHACQLRFQVVGCQHRVIGDLAQAVGSVGAYVCVRANENSGVAENERTRPILSGRSPGSLQAEAAVPFPKHPW